MDFLTFLGLSIGLAAVLIGQVLEGGHVSSLINGPAFLIVIGGSLGAMMVQTPFEQFIHSIKLINLALFPPRLTPERTIKKLIEWSNIARKEGLLGLEAISEQEPDSFTTKGLQLLVDGTEPEAIRGILELEITAKEERDTHAAKFYESMGGYSPTIGIIGAVMGLIHVMENLSDPSKLGAGIATAFVATIYGVGAANMILIPLSGKLKTKVNEQAKMREMIMEGLISIAEGDNPRNLELKLYGYL